MIKPVKKYPQFTLINIFIILLWPDSSASSILLYKLTYMYPKECKWIHVDKPQSITTYKDICIYNGYIIVSINKSITYQYYQWLLYVPRGVVLLTPRSETDEQKSISRIFRNLSEIHDMWTWASFTHMNSKVSSLWLIHYDDVQGITNPIPIRLRDDIILTSSPNKNYPCLIFVPALFGAFPPSHAPTPPPLPEIWLNSRFSPEKKLLFNSFFPNGKVALLCSPFPDYPHGRHGVGKTN